MDNQDKISVIMACYNSEKTIRKAIDSILAQTYTNWVMICCDDGSTDRTLDILKEYKSRYPDKFIIIRNKKNRQLPYSLNHCLRYVKTDLVARMDADDWSLPERFEKQVRFLKTHLDFDLVSTGVSVSDGSRIVASIIKKEVPTKESMLRQNAFSHATIMTYKRVYDALGGYSLEPWVLRVEDVDLWCRFLAKGFKGYNMSEELYVIVEDPSAVKRRGFRSRLNSARTRYHGYHLMGFRGWVCVKPFLIVLKAFVPSRLYLILHNRKLHRNKNV